MKKSVNGVYFPNLNGVRFIAALSVLIYHFYDTLNGHLGVILFFVLSGFLITYLLLEEKENHNYISIKKFYIRRILRIWPLYFLIVLIGSLFFLSQSDLNGDQNFFYSLFFYVLFIPNVAFVLDIGLSYAAILWSVGSEEQFYLLWPWLIKIKKSKRIILIFIFIIIFFSFVPHIIDYINNYYYNNSKNFLYYSSRVLLRMSFNSMATGGLLAFLYKFKPGIIKILFNKIFQLISLIVLLYCWILNVEFFFNDQFYATLFGILILNLAVNPKVIFSLENRVFNYLGKISYGLYVYHQLSFYITAYVITNWVKLNFLGSMFNFILGIFTTVLMSSVSYYLYERHFLKLKLSRFSLVKSGDMLIEKNK